VFADGRDATEAAEELESAGIHTLEVHDNLRALRAEMTDEQPVGPFTDEMRRGILPGVILATALGAIVGVPLGLPSWSGLELGVRLVITIGVGALAGALYGFFVGGGVNFETQVQGKEMDAERGVAVEVTVAGDAEAERAAKIIQLHRPVRIDELAE
jgi:hypothetical protein